jgi:hypothetical protein
VRSRSLEAVREHRNALGRLLLHALQPYPRRPALTNTIVNLVGLVALPIITWVIGNLLLGAVVFLSVAVLLLLIAGTRIERQLHGDLGIPARPKSLGAVDRAGCPERPSQDSQFQRDRREYRTCTAAQIPAALGDSLVRIRIPRGEHRATRLAVPTCGSRRHLDQGQ